MKVTHPEPQFPANLGLAKSGYRRRKDAQDGQVHVIRHKVLVEGCSIRSVASDLGVSRNTVRKYLTESEPKRVQRVTRKAPVREEAERRWHSA